MKAVELVKQLHKVFLVTWDKTHLLKGTFKFEGTATCGTHDFGKPGQSVVGRHVEETAHPAGGKLDEVEGARVASNLLSVHL